MMPVNFKPLLQLFEHYNHAVLTVRDAKNMSESKLNMLRTCLLSSHQETTKNLIDCNQSPKNLIGGKSGIENVSLLVFQEMFFFSLTQTYKVILFHMTLPTVEGISTKHATNKFYKILVIELVIQMQ
jgi:hypothetical protein